MKLFIGIIFVIGVVVVIGFVRAAIEKTNAASERGDVRTIHDLREYVKRLLLGRSVEPSLTWQFAVSEESLNELLRLRAAEELPCLRIDAGGGSLQLYSTPWPGRLLLEFPMEVARQTKHEPAVREVARELGLPLATSFIRGIRFLHMELRGNNDRIVERCSRVLQEAYSVSGETPIRYIPI